MIAAAHLWKRFTKNSFDKISALSPLNFSTSVVKKALRNDMLLEILVDKHQFPPRAAARVASALSHVRNPQKTDAALSFFESAGFSTSQLEKIAKYRPQFLSASLESCIKPKIKIFQDLGYSSSELADLITGDPWLLRRNLNGMVPSVTVLRRLLGSDDQVSRLLRVSGWFLSTDLRRTLEPNVEHLKSCGVPFDRLVSLLFTSPRFLLADPENMRRSTEKADEMGVRRGSKMFVHALRILSSYTEETLQKKLRVFKDVGFSEEDVSRIFRQAPIVFSASERKVREVVDIVVSTGKYEVSDVVRSAACVGRSVEGWYRPRFAVLGALEGGGILRDWPRFSTLLRTSNEGFVEKYVAPYEDLVGDLYCGKDEEKVRVLASVKKRLRS